ncbi:VOC family protein [Amaricoccus macauensis]|uniref:VOC family protein n=1 Tax=Amaricoccus macauensis TaxID=57001 RepID=UPI003C7A7694
MIDHITFGVGDLSRSVAFYDMALTPLGFRRLCDLHEGEGGGVRVCGYGAERPQFWLAEENATSGMMHVAFAALSREAVDVFHVAALAAGGSDNGAPGLRPRYHSGYYAAFVLDPDGHNIEAVCHTG